VAVRKRNPAKRGVFSLRSYSAEIQETKKLSTTTRKTGLSLSFSIFFVVFPAHFFHKPLRLHLGSLGGGEKHKTPKAPNPKKEKKSPRKTKIKCPKKSKKQERKTEKKCPQKFD
jgi:hypothetical protein